LNKKYFTTVNILLFISLIVPIAQFSYLLDCYKFTGILLYNLITNFSKAFVILDFDSLELVITSILILFVPVSLFYLRKRISRLIHNVSSSIVFLFLLFYSMIFAPIISEQHPNFHKDISVTKLLPPFSSVNYILLNQNKESDKSDLMLLKDNTIKKSFNNNIVFIDSLTRNGSNCTVFQKFNSTEYSITDVVSNEHGPVIYTKHFWFGTDHIGRDVLSMLVYGSRISIMVGLGSVFISLILGIGLGFIAGNSGGIIDIILSRLTDMFLAFPSLFLVLLILALFGNNLLSVIFVLGFSGWMSLFKIVKGEVIGINGKDYLLASKMLGLNNKHILFNDILPVIASPILVNLVFQFANVILAESTLSFLGLGVGIDHNSWGTMIQSGQEYLSKGWWMILIPGVTLVFTLFSFNFFADKLNKRLNPLIAK